MCQCVVRTVIMYFLYQGLHALVLVSEYGGYRIRFLVVVWSACLIVGLVGILVSLHSGPLVCRSNLPQPFCLRGVVRVLRGIGLASYVFL